MCRVGMEQKPSVSVVNLKHKHIATWLLQTLVSFLGTDMAVHSMSTHCSMSPHLTVIKCKIKCCCGLLLQLLQLVLGFSVYSHIFFGCVILFLRISFLGNQLLKIPNYLIAKYFQEINQSCLGILLIEVLKLFYCSI